MTLKDATIIIAHPHPLQEIVSMKRCIVVKRHADIAHVCFYQHLWTGGILMESGRIWYDIIGLRTSHQRQKQTVHYKQKSSSHIHTFYYYKTKVMLF